MAIKTKTVNRTGKKLTKKSLVIKAKKTAVKVEDIKKINEKVAAEKLAITNIQKTISKQDPSIKVQVANENEQKEDKKYTLTIGLKELFGAGCHLGHKISKTHPKAKENIFAAKDGIQVIDLAKTVEALEKACNFIYNAKRNGKKIVLVGTKRQAREIVRRVALDAGVAYVTDRWLGGTITNWEQIRKDIKKYLDTKEGLEKGKFTESTKKEILEMNKEQIRLDKIIGGLISLDRLFDIVFVVDAGFEKTAIKEAGMRGIKTVAMVDTDADPQKVDFAIPTNDDNVKTISIIVEEIGRAIKSA